MYLHQDEKQTKVRTKRLVRVYICLSLLKKTRLALCKKKKKKKKKKKMFMRLFLEVNNEK